MALGLCWEAWFQGIHLTTFSKKSLRDVEFQHPYIPSMHTVFLILLTTLQLYMMSLIVLQGTVFPHNPQEWLFFGVIFVLSMTMGIVAELHWLAVADMFFSFSTGTLSMFIIILLKSIHLKFSFVPFALTMLFLLSLVFLVLLYRRTRNRGIPIVFLSTFVLWLLIRFLSM